MYRPPEQKMRAYPTAGLALILALLAGAPAAAGDFRAGEAATAAGVEEELSYRWRLGGFKGFLARLIVPGQGEAVLRKRRVDDRLITELHITSPQSRSGEFWRYGSEVESPDCRRLHAAWTEQFFRGREKEKRAEIGEGGILDIPSAICRIRQDLPNEPIETRIWSDGRVYPVRIRLRALGVEAIEGRTVATRTYVVEGIDRPGERSWKGQLELVLAGDAAATPLEIAMVQTGLEVVLELVNGL